MVQAYQERILGIKEGIRNPEDRDFTRVSAGT